MKKNNRFLGNTALAGVMIGSALLGGCGLGMGNSSETFAAITAVTPTDGKIISLVNEDMGEFCAQSRIDGALAQEYVTHTDNYAPVPVTLTFESEENTATYVVRLATDESFRENVAEYETSTTSVTVKNLWVNTKYFWQVEVPTAEGGNVSKTFTFQTAMTPRTVWWEGVSNTRDIGGYPLAQGGKVAQGKVYRGGMLNEITPSGIAEMKEMGVKTILDLRTQGENGAGTQSPVEGISYIGVADLGIEQAPFYEIFTDSQKQAMGKLLQVFANAENYPIYFHCSLGRDRTGTLAYLLNALMGVEVEYLRMDYMTSAFSVRGTYDAATYMQLEENLNRMFSKLNMDYEGANFSEKVAAYALSCGLTEAEIAAIKQNLTA